MAGLEVGWGGRLITLVTGWFCGRALGTVGSGGIEGRAAKEILCLCGIPASLSPLLK